MKTFKISDKVNISGDKMVYDVEDVDLNAVWIRGVGWVNFKCVELANSATIAGRTYPIPDEKVDQVKNLVDPGMPKWWDLPALELPTVLYKLYKAANYVNEGWKPDWKDREQDKYSICYDGSKFITPVNWSVSHGIPSFKSTAAALRAVELFRANGDYDELVRFYQS